MARTRHPKTQTAKTTKKSTGITNNADIDRLKKIDIEMITKSIGSESKYYSGKQWETREPCSADGWNI